MLLRVLALYLIATISMAETEVEKPTVVAMLAGESVTTQDIVEYSSLFPQLRPLLSKPGGPMQILEKLLMDRALVLEGEHQEISRDSEDDIEYAYKVQAELLPSCPAPSETEALQFYKDNPQEFSTPVLLRIQRIGISFDENNPSPTTKKLREIRDDIQNNDLDFADAARQYSGDILSKDRGGDLGFLPVDPEQENPILNALMNKPQGEIIGPVPQEDMAFLYRVTDRQEPILASFESVQDEIAQAAVRQCRQQSIKDLRAELWSRWSVEILVPDIGTWSRG